MKEEFEALGTDPFPERGAVTDEYLDACRELWTKEDPRFDGQICQIRRHPLRAAAGAEAHPPIWVGGESGPALRRTAQIGDAWYPIGTNPQHRLDSMKRFQGGIERLRRLAREAGPRPVGDRARLPRHAARAASLPTRPMTASGGCSPASDADDRRRSAGFSDFGVDRGRFQLRRRQRRRDARQYAALPRGRAGESLILTMRQ